MNKKKEVAKAAAPSADGVPSDILKGTSEGKYATKKTEKTEEEKKEIVFKTVVEGEEHHRIVLDTSLDPNYQKDLSLEWLLLNSWSFPPSFSHNLFTIIINC